MTDADIVREALEHLRSCTYSLVLLLKNVDVELRDEIMRHIDVVPKAHDALDGLVARLAEAERERDEAQESGKRWLELYERAVDLGVRGANESSIQSVVPNQDLGRGEEQRT